MTLLIHSFAASLDSESTSLLVLFKIAVASYELNWTEVFRTLSWQALPGFRCSAKKPWHGNASYDRMLRTHSLVLLKLQHRPVSGILWSSESDAALLRPTSAWLVDRGGSEPSQRRLCLTRECGWSLSVRGGWYDWNVVVDLVHDCGIPLENLGHSCLKNWSQATGCIMMHSVLPLIIVA